MVTANDKEEYDLDRPNQTLSKSASSTPSTTAIETVSTKSVHNLTGLPLKLVIFSLCLAQFLSALDITIVSTALPTIAHELRIDGASYTWVGSSYNLASTASTPLWAKCSDIWGRKPLLLLANLTFMAGSLVAGLAYNGVMLIAGRTLQGLGGGGIVIMVSIIIADLFPLNERAKYYGFSAVVWAIASALGPVLGGVFTQTAGWKWCFLINVPLDGISLIFLYLILRISTPHLGVVEGLKTFDWIGCMTIVGGTICFLCGLEGGASTNHGWTSAYTLGLLLSGVALIVSFVVFEHYFAKHPIIPMRVFVGRVNIAALVAATFHGFVFISYDYFLPLYYQVVLGATPILSGVYLFALIIPLSLLASGTGFYIKRTGNYHLAARFGSIVMTIGTGIFIGFGTNRELWKIIVFQIIAGIGVGPLFLSPMIALQNHLRKEDVASGTSAYTFLRSIASSISIVIGGVILQKRLGGNSLTTIDAGSQQNRGSDGLEQRNETYVKALRIMWIFYTTMCAVVILSSLMISQHGTEKEHTSHSNRSMPRNDIDQVSTSKHEVGR